MTRINNPRSEPPARPARKPAMTRQKAARLNADAEYNALRDVYLRENRQCCWCMMPATEVHHICGGIHRRKSLANSDTWLAVCQACHRYIESQPVRLQCLIKHLATDAAIERCRQ